LRRALKRNSGEKRKSPEETPLEYLLRFPDAELLKGERQVPWWIAWAARTRYAEQPDDEVNLEKELLSRKWKEIKDLRKSGWTYVLVECDVRGENNRAAVARENSEPTPTIQGRGVHPWRLDEKIVEAAFQALQKVAGQNLPDLRDANSQS
jgi:hypothetical protein